MTLRGVGGGGGGAEGWVGNGVVAKFWFRTDAAMEMRRGFCYWEEIGFSTRFLNYVRRNSWFYDRVPPEGNDVGFGEFEEYLWRCDAGFIETLLQSKHRGKEGCFLVKTVPFRDKRFPYLPS